MPGEGKGREGVERGRAETVEGGTNRMGIGGRWWLGGGGGG